VLAATLIYQSAGWTPGQLDEQRRQNLAWLTTLSLLDQLRRNPSVRVDRAGLMGRLAVSGSRAS
jgi:hypothetical protein